MRKWLHLPLGLGLGFGVRVTGRDDEEVAAPAVRVRGLG